MTAELTWLAWSLMLALVQILTVAAVRTRQYGTKWNMGARDGVMPPLSLLADRLNRAQANLFETLPLFIAAVLIAHVSGRSNAMTLLGCQLYVVGRVIYVPLYAAGVPVVRTIVWAVSLLGLVMVIGALLT